MINRDVTCLLNSEGTNTCTYTAIYFKRSVAVLHANLT